MASFYIHIPFCEHKCVYCDFYSIESLDPVERFLHSLHKEIDLFRSQYGTTGIETIFFGGGTPSLLEPAAIGSVLDHLARAFSITPGAEITLEANPGTVESRRLGGFRGVGVNRISFGIQSFFDDDLAFLTRIHSASEAQESVRIAQKLGFSNISLDLIFALPGQTESRWEQNLRTAVDLSPQHISAYSLIVEEGTPLARMVRSKLVSPAPVEHEASMYEFTMDFLHHAGYEHYEVSNYARPGFRSVHNGNYWNHTPYFGFGPSAHSFDTRRRSWNIANIRQYCEMLERDVLPVAGQEILTAEERCDEAVMLGLRSGGVDLHRLHSEGGIDLLSTNRRLIERLVGEGLATCERNVLRLTDKGFLLCDSISENLLAAVV